MPGLDNLVQSRARREGPVQVAELLSSPDPSRGFGKPWLRAIKTTSAVGSPGMMSLKATDRVPHILITPGVRLSQRSALCKLSVGRYVLGSALASDSKRFSTSTGVLGPSSLTYYKSRRVEQSVGKTEQADEGSETSFHIFESAGEVRSQNVIHYSY